MEMKLNEITKEGHLNSEVEVLVLISDIKIRIARNDKRFVDFVIQDASQVTDAKFWDYEENKDLIDSLKVGDIVRMRVFINEYKDQLQLTVREIEKVENADMKEYIVSSTWKLESMEEGLEFFYNKVENPKLKKLLDNTIFSKKYYEKFITHPAAKRVHHNYYHGLLQHTLEVLKYAYTVATTSNLSKRQTERLIVMSMLHDWGKVVEYAPLPEIEYTNEGEMLGHIFIGSHLVSEAMGKIEDFDNDDRLIILNGILGHHGSFEFGSPVLPKTIEAQILHQADMISSKSDSILTFMSSEESEGGDFTSRLWNMGAVYYKKGI